MTPRPSRTRSTPFSVMRSAAREWRAPPLPRGLPFPAGRTPRGSPAAFSTASDAEVARAGRPQEAEQGSDRDEPSLGPSAGGSRPSPVGAAPERRGGASARRSEEHTSELQSLRRISYAV